MSASTIISDNPLLQGVGLPSFAEIKAERVVPAFNQLLAELEHQLTSLEASVQPTWSGLVETLRKADRTADLELGGGESFNGC